MTRPFSLAEIDEALHPVIRSRRVTGPAAPPPAPAIAAEPEARAIAAAPEAPALAPAGGSFVAARRRSQLYWYAVQAAAGVSAVRAPFALGVDGQLEVLDVE